MAKLVRVYFMVLEHASGNSVHNYQNTHRYFKHFRRNCLIMCGSYLMSDNVLYRKYYRQPKIIIESLYGKEMKTISSMYFL